MFLQPNEVFMFTEIPLVYLPYGKVGILSDVHDHLTNLRKVLQIATESGIDTLLFAGDFCSPIPVAEMLKFPGCIHAVWGNGDGDRVKIQQLADARPGILFLHGEFAHFQMGGAKGPTIAMTHYWFYAQALARTGDYDLVVSGHTHESRLMMFCGKICLNPGEVYDLKGEPSFAIYDPLKPLERQIEFVRLT